MQIIVRSVMVTLAVLLALSGELAIAQDEEAMQVVSPDQEVPITLTFPVTMRPTTIDLNEKYLRLTSYDPSPSDKLTLEQKSALKLALEGIRSHLVSTQSSLYISARPKVAGVQLPQQGIYYFLKSNSDDPVESKDPEELTPSFPASKKVSITITALRKKSIESEAARSVVQAAKAAAMFVANPLKLVTALAKPDMDKISEHIDTVVSKAFSNSTSKPKLLQFDAAKTEKIDIQISTAEEKPTTLVGIRVEALDTLIAPKGLKSFSNRDAELLSYMVENKKSVKDLIDADKLSVEAFSKETADGFQIFCKRADGILSDAGLNRYDRAAVLYAYLNTSLWNALYGMRIKVPKTDFCSDRTADLSKTNLDQIKSTDALAKEDAQARADAIKYINDELFKAIGSINSPEGWSNLLANSVSFTAVGAGIELSKSYKIPVTPGQQYPIDDAAELLGRYFLYSPNPGKCFSLFNLSSSGTIRTECFSLKIGGKQEPVTIHFGLDKAYNKLSHPDPKIASLRIYQE